VYTVPSGATATATALTPPAAAPSNGRRCGPDGAVVSGWPALDGVTVPASVVEPASDTEVLDEVDGAVDPSSLRSTITATAAIAAAAIAAATMTTSRLRPAGGR